MGQATKPKQTMDLAMPPARTRDGLRPAELSRDLFQITELLKLVFGENLDSDDAHYFRDNSLSINDLFHHQNSIASRLGNGFVWQSDGRIVGNVTLLTTRAWDRYLVANVAVNPAYRRRGIARSLMAAVTDFVKKQGGRVILLQAVKDNQPALDLYRSLGYENIGTMVSWKAAGSRIRQISVNAGDDLQPHINLLPSSMWPEAYELDISCVPRDLNWPEPLLPDAYQRTWWQRFSDFLNGRQTETWVATDTARKLTGLVNISCEWGLSNIVTLRVKPDHIGSLERILLAKAVRRLQYLPRRNVRIDHPESDQLTNTILKEANFTIQRTLTHMRLELV